MTENGVRKQQEERTELSRLEDEYERIAENEAIFDEEVSPWQKLSNFLLVLWVIIFIFYLVSALLMPSDAPSNFSVRLQQYPIQTVSPFVFIMYSVFMMIASRWTGRRISKIRNELGLHEEESLYMHCYDTYRNLESHIEETNPKRKVYFKRLAVRSAEELVETVNDWEYGNVRLVSDLIGNQIDLLKDNVKRLVLPNVAKGEEADLQKASQRLLEFCKYLRSPSVVKLGELNEKMKELPYKEYKFITKKERLGGYLNAKPRFFRLLFAGVITAIIMGVLWFLNQGLGVLVAVAVPCFWGAFSGFDKIFKIKE